MRRTGAGLFHQSGVGFGADGGQLLEMKLYDLAKFYSDDGSESDEETDDDDDELISDKQKKELVNLFKAMEDPEGEGKKFCKKYGIKKVAELPKSKFKKAVKHLDSII